MSAHTTDLYTAKQKLSSINIISKERKSLSHHTLSLPLSFRFADERDRRRRQVYALLLCLQVKRFVALQEIIE